MRNERRDLSMRFERLVEGIVELLSFVDPDTLANQYEKSMG